MERWLTCRRADPFTNARKRILIVCWSVGSIGTGMGRCLNESAYRLDDCIVQAPDLSVLNSERRRRKVENQSRVAPDLAVEICTSNMEARASGRSFLGLGVQSNHPNGLTETLEQDQILEDPHALPGFSTSVSAIFEGL